MSGCISGRGTARTEMDAARERLTAADGFTVEKVAGLDAEPCDSSKLGHAAAMAAFTLLASILLIICALFLI